MRPWIPVMLLALILVAVSVGFLQYGRHYHRLYAIAHIYAIAHNAETEAQRQQAPESPEHYFDKVEVAVVVIEGIWLVAFLATVISFVLAFRTDLRAWSIRLAFLATSLVGCSVVTFYCAQSLRARL
jgi:hypothetical protein